MLLSEGVLGANIGVSPASMFFSKVLRGGYSERNIIISTDVEEPVDIELDGYGEIADWINTSYMNFSVSRGGPFTLKVMVIPPDDTPNGNYTGLLRISTSPFGEGVEGHAVGRVRSSLDLLITVEVIDIEILDCGVSRYEVQSAEKGDDVVFTLDISNNGNIRIRPTIVIDLWDQDQISVVKSEEFLEEEVFPSVKRGYEVRISSDDLSIGQYWAEVIVPDCLSTQLLTFDILEEGALKAVGLLLGIVTRKTAKVDETIPVMVQFKNVGEKEVDAQFKGKVTLGDRVIQILESEKEKVSISEINKFNFYFTPRKPGKYVISGRVFYSSKKTFESSATIEVSGERIRLRSFAFIVVYVFLILLMLTLFYKIRKERRAYLKNLRSIK